MQVHKYILFARQTIPFQHLQTAMARHHSFTSSQSEIKSTPTLPTATTPQPSRSQPPHPRRPPPAVRVGCSEARASKQASREQCGWSLSQYCGTARSCSRQLVAAAQSRRGVQQLRQLSPRQPVSKQRRKVRACSGGYRFARKGLCPMFCWNNSCVQLVQSNHLFRLRCIHVDGAPSCILPGEAQKHKGKENLDL